MFGQMSPFSPIAFIRYANNSAVILGLSHSHIASCSFIYPVWAACICTKYLTDREEIVEKKFPDWLTELYFNCLVNKLMKFARPFHVEPLPRPKRKCIFVFNCIHKMQFYFLDYTKGFLPLLKCLFWGI